CSFSAFLPSSRAAKVARSRRKSEGWLLGAPAAWWQAPILRCSLRFSRTQVAGWSAPTQSSWPASVPNSKGNRSLLLGFRLSILVLLVEWGARAEVQMLKKMPPARAPKAEWPQRGAIGSGPLYYQHGPPNADPIPRDFKERLAHSLADLGPAAKRG